MKPDFAASWTPTAPFPEGGLWLALGGGYEATHDIRPQEQAYRRKYMLRVYQKTFDDAAIHIRPALEPTQDTPRLKKDIDIIARQKVLTSPFAVFIFEFLPTILIAAAIGLGVVGYLALASAAYAAALSSFIVAGMAVLTALAIAVTYSRMKEEWRRRLSVR